MSLLLASRLLDDYGVTCAVLTPDHDPQFVHVDTDAPITPGKAALVRQRCQLAVHDHIRIHRESWSLLEDGTVWTVRLVDGPVPGTRIWRVLHDGCRTLRSAA